MNPPQDKIEIDESKIVKGQMKYVLKLMKMVKKLEQERCLTELKGIRGYIQDSKWCNAHDVGMLEDLIKYIKDIEKKLKETKK